MDVRRLTAELVQIAQNPRAGSVAVTTSGVNTTYTFTGAYYYPAGIAQISIVRGGANVIYVYTTAGSQYPHLTIPDDGVNVHWTVAAATYDDANRPQSIQNFVSQFP